MSYGVGILLIVVGAVLSFAIRDSIDFIDLTMTGYILMGAGVLGLLLGLVLTMRSRTSTEVVHSSADPVSGEGVTVKEHSVR